MLTLKARLWSKLVEELLLQVTTKYAKLTRKNIKVLKHVDLEEHTQE